MKVGFSTVKITPKMTNRLRPLQLAGYSPRELCTGVHDDLFARCVYIEGKDSNPSSRVLMMVCDVLSIHKGMAKLVKKKISSLIPIDPENITISATHTHHGPDYRGMFLTGGFTAALKGFFFPIPQTSDLIRFGVKLIEAAIQAYRAREIAKIGVLQTYIPENRRIMLNRRDPFNPSAAKYPVTVIKVVRNSQKKQKQGGDRKNQDLLGLIVNYAVHGTVLPRDNTLITADYVGYLIQALEGAYPELKGNFIYFNGPCGEINPLSSELKKKMDKAGSMEGISNDDIYDQKGTWEDARRIGSTIAQQALSVVDEIACQEQQKVSVIQKSIYVPILDFKYGSSLSSALKRLAFASKKVLFTALAKIGVLKTNIFLNAEQISKGRIKTMLQLIDLGNTIAVTTPGEYFLRLGNEVLESAKEKDPEKAYWMIELANDAIGYLFTIEAYLEGGYESSFSLTPLGGRFIAAKLKSLISDYLK